MNPTHISQAKGAAVFDFSYDRADVADTFTFSAGNWVPFTADSEVTVLDTVTGSGTITFSVGLHHLEEFSSAHVTWQGSGTVEFSVDNATWTALDQHGAIALTPESDLDLRVTLADGDELTSLTVYVFQTDTVYPLRGMHFGTFTGDAIHDDTLVLRGGELAIQPDPSDPPVNVRTIEFIGAMDTGSGEIALGPCDVRLTDGLVVLQDNCTLYVNGLPYTWVGYEPTQNNHYVIVLDADTNELITLGQIDMTMTHLALYDTALTASDVAKLYAAQDPQPIRINDTGVITVTESTPAVDSYAFAWSIVSGGTS
jgi:hypothetical protein